jgi:hypothetical protein
MDFLTALNVVAGIASIVGTFLTVLIYRRSVVQLRDAVRIAFEIDVRKTINRIERNKEKFKEGVPEAYKELFDVQDELETMSKKFLAMFHAEK